MAGLRISPSFELPIDIVTEAVGIVAVRGAGKTYTSVVLIEEAHANGVQAVVIDATGVYHGLRTAADGHRDGLPFYVFGGQHGDLPLEAQHGPLIADVVVESGESFVLALSDFSKTKARQFVADFLERLYERKARSRTPLMLVVDEADEWAPQKPRGESARCLGAVEQVAKRGRSRGIGVVLITQRTQAINKDVLDLIETMFAMRLTAPRSRATVKEWLDVKESTDELGVIESLPSLPTGTAWAWSPVRGILERVEVRRIRTFDSYAAPKPGEAKPEPGSRTPLDLEALGEQMRATVERAKENDPAELRKRVRALEAEARQQRAAEPEQVRVPVEVPVLTDEQLEVLTSIVAEIRDVAEAVSALRAVADQIESGLRSVSARARPARAPVPPPRPARREPSPGRDSEEISAYALGLLRTLAERHPMRLTRAQISTFSGRKPRSSAFSAAMAEIVRGGYVHVQGGQHELTVLGLETVGDVPVAPADPVEMWRAALPAYERDLFDAIVAAWPAGLTRPELSERTGRSLTSSAFSAAISTLAKNGLADIGAGEVRASDDLFAGARA